MAYFHVTYNQGRTDNVTLEATSHLSIMSFFQEISTAKITMIKEILFSKEHQINDRNQIVVEEPFSREIRAMVQTKKHKNKIITFRFAKKSLTKDQIIKLIKQYVQIDDEPITKVINILRWNNAKISSSI